MYVDQLTIRNLRCFTDAQFNFCYPGKPGTSGIKRPNVNVLLGDNGSGKSTVLMAAALSALAPIMSRSGYVARNLIRQGENGASALARLVLHQQDGAIAGKEIEREAKLKRGGDFDDFDVDRHLANDSYIDALLDDNSPTFFIVGYSSSRRVESSQNFNPEGLRRGRVRYLRVGGLFEPQFVLTPLTHWYDDISTKTAVRDREVAEAFQRLLPKDIRFSGKRSKSSYGEFLFTEYGVDVPFDALSDGYRGYIGWISDLLFHLTTGRIGDYKLIDSRGIVIVDEIDLHLHPEWQRNVIAQVSCAFPNIQFIFSTHSPIVAGSVESENLFVMERSETGESSIQRLDQNVYGMDALQILHSPAFGLVSTRAPEVAREIQALSVQAATDPEAALRLMKRMAGVGSSPKP